MLRIYHNSNAQAAKAYYGDSLSSRADYHFRGLEDVGEWQGRANQWLGLSGRVQKDDFGSLIDNRYPGTNKKLTQAHFRNRRVCYDFNFHLPKGVSLLYMVTGDDRILAAFEDAVHATMVEMERDAQVRVRTGGRNENRNIGNWVYASFLHYTSRLVDGSSDPHIHMHCVLPNAGYDSHESKWKALEIGLIKSQARRHEAAFHNRMHKSMRDMGFPTARFGDWWDVTYFDRSTLTRHSRRTQEIERMARALDITDAVLKAELGAKTRQRKSSAISEPSSLWEARQRILAGMSEEERNLLARFRKPTEPSVTPQECVRLALETHFERKSSVKLHLLEESALRAAGGQWGNAHIEEALYGHPDLIVTTNDDGVDIATTKQVVEEEKEMLDMCKQGIGTYRALAPGQHEIEDPQLQGKTSHDQVSAIRHVWQSKDFVSLVRGVAGSGKTKMMREMVRGLEQSKRRVIPLAPTITASRENLRKEGFEDANTIAAFMASGYEAKQMREHARGGVIIVDEAGLVGTRELRRLMVEAKKLDARLVLVGDEMQHKPVQRGDAFRLLREQGGVETAELQYIFRQQGEYKEIVEMMSRGEAAESFERFDEKGWVKEIEDSQDRYDRLSKEYADIAKAYRDKGQKESMIVVCPTHAEGEEVTQAVRAELKERGILAGERTDTIHHRNQNWDDATKGDAARYQEGMTVRFNRNVTGFDTQQWYWVSGRDEQNVKVVDHSDNEHTLPLDKAKCFDVHHPRMIDLMPGDRVRITRNITDQRGQRLAKGNIYGFEGKDENGQLKLDNGSLIHPLEGTLSHAVTTTSHSSQSLTVDHVFLAASAMSKGATSLHQWYVSLSRGRVEGHIYTDSKEDLQQAITYDGTEPSGLELQQFKVQREYAEQVMQARQAMQGLYGSYNMQDAGEPISPRTPAHELQQRQGPEYEREYKS